MDMLTVDISRCPSASFSSQVTLWGDGLPLESIAQVTKRSPYELLTAIQHRVQFTWEGVS